MSLKTISFAEIRRVAAGRYVFLAKTLSQGLLDAALQRPGQHVPNPFKEHSKDGLRLYRDFNDRGMMVFNDGLGNVSFPDFLVKAGICRDYRAAMLAIGDALGLLSCNLQEKVTKVVPPKAPPVAAEDYAHNARKLNALLSNCVTLDDPQAAVALKYFAARGIKLNGAPRELRNAILVNPKCAYSDDGKSVSYHPAIILKVRNKEGALCSLHRTYLSSDGTKANVACPKKLMPPTRPCTPSDHSRFVRLGSPSSDGIIGVAEGLETALSVTYALRISVWCCLSAAFLERFIPPAEVKAVIIFADKDVSGTGQISAQRLKAQLIKSGIPAFILYPQEAIVPGSKGVDFNDTLKERGSFGFPNPIRLIDYVRSHIVQQTPTPKSSLPKALRKI